MPSASRPRPSGRLAHLDGLRGVAVLLVVAAHTVHKAEKEDAPWAGWFQPLLTSDTGVTLFFVLSGYLITTILVREKKGTGQISVIAFYRRRALRIWPAFYVLLAVTVLVASATTVVTVTSGQATSAGLFVWNYSPWSGGWWLGHIWSLSVEEQFYFVWPLVLIFYAPQTALRIALVGIVIAPVIRTVSYVAEIGDNTHLGIYFHTRYDSMLIGAALALLVVVSPRVNTWLVAFVARWRLAGVAVTAIAASAYLSHQLGGKWNLPLGYSIQGAGGAAILLAVQRDGFTRQALSFRPLVVIGTISYSLYLWQQLFLASEWHGTPVMGSVALAPLLAVVVAAISYYLTERPYQRARARKADNAVSIGIENSPRE